MQYRPIVLVILDGWGISHNIQGNVLKKAQLPTIESLTRSYPMTAIQASGISVGIPWGESGNSEVGHITLGAGRIMYQNLPRITLSIQDKSFFKNGALLSAINSAKENAGALHLMGLLGEGVVHAYPMHLHALLELAKKEGLEKVYIHIFTDGRDSSPTSGTRSIADLEAKIKDLGVGRIASIIGRNWAMDRNNNWDRIEKAYSMLTEGKGVAIGDPKEYLQQSYAKGITDEYIEPAIVCENQTPIALIKDNDSVIFFNFREDRARELTKAFVLPGFEKFKRNILPKVNFVTMIEYERNLPTAVAFPPREIEVGLGEILSRNGLKQLRIAETEKYAHVTYFFNGGREEPFVGEDRVLVPSPSVSRFDEAPEMSCYQITEKSIEAIRANKYDFILINYANADIVGHTGIEEACILAVQSIDKSLSILVPEVLKVGGCLLITADHGNIEEVLNRYTGDIDTEHSANPVPLWYITPDNQRERSTEEIIRGQSEVKGFLSDIAPTVLEIAGLGKPEVMSGESLLSILK